MVKLCQRLNISKLSVNYCFQFEFKRVFFTFDARVRHQSVRIIIFCLLIELSSNCSKFFQEDLLCMCRPLLLNMIHNLASLPQLQVSPVSYIHFKNILLVQLDLSLSQEVDVLVLKHRRCSHWLD